LEDTGENRFNRRILICMKKLPKVFLHPPPPLERESVAEVVGLMIQKVLILSIPEIGL
jgi:hypothetical protein